VLVSIIKGGGGWGIATVLLRGHAFKEEKGFPRY